MHERREEVQWGMRPTTVYGTLVIPPGSGPFPAVLMAAGSGPTDRDWNSPLLPGSNGSGRLLADVLAEVGFASLRYDKRGVGPHAGENLPYLLGQVSMRSHRDEFAGGVSLLAQRSEIRGDRIFGLGNSEGTLHVLHYQLAGPPVPLVGIVLTGPPGRSVSKVARAQLAAQAAIVPDGDAMLELYDRAIDRFLAGQPAAPDPALPEGVKALFSSLEAPLNLPFARELWRADAASLVRDLAVPALVIIGKKDLQVDWQLDGEAFMRAQAGNPDLAVCLPDHADHLLKHEPKDRDRLVPPEVATSYNAAGRWLDPETLMVIQTWLTAHAC